MASIFPRKNADGSITWRVMIRRKNIKQFITPFSSKEDAIAWVKENERKYCNDPDNFQYDHLKSRRERDITRKNYEKT